jgi:hypothetical protein
MSNPKYRATRFKQLKSDQKKKNISLKINDSQKNRFAFGEGKLLLAKQRKLKDYLKLRILNEVENSHLAKFKKEMTFYRNGKLYINEKKFNAFFKHSYLSGCLQSIQYINISEKILSDLVSRKEFKNSHFLFLDRDATILEFIFKSLSAKQGFSKTQFESILFPKNIYDVLFKKINQKIKIKEQDMSKYYSILFSEKNKLKIIEIIKDLIKKNSVQFKPIIIYLRKKASLIPKDKPIVLFETGAFGTSLKLSQYLLEVLFPDRKIYTAIVYGSNVSNKYIDYVYNQSSSFAINSKYFENYPKAKGSLHSLNLSRKGKIYSNRENLRGVSDPNDYLFESKIFNLALSNMLVYKNKGVDVTNPFFQERYVDNLNKTLLS